MSSIVPRVAAKNLWKLPLSAFASTTSAELAGIISDETGTGLLVFNTSPTFAASILGSASMDVFNTVSTTVNAFGAATSLSIGAATGTLTVANTTLAAKAGTFSTTLAVTGNASLPAIITNSGELTVTPAAGSSLNVVLSTTGNFSVNTDQIKLVTSTGNVGIGSAYFTSRLSVQAPAGIRPFHIYSNAIGSNTQIFVAFSDYGSVGTTIIDWRSNGDITIAGVLKSNATSGSNNFLAPVSIAAGTVGAPSIYLSTDTTTGLYRIGANNLGVTVSGSKVLDIASTGLGITGLLSATTSILSSGAISGIGYATGAGGTVNQGAGAGKATGVTLAKVCGTVTMDAANLNADTTVTFLLTMTGFTLIATDQMVITHISGGTLGSYHFNSRYASATTMNIDVRNITPGNLAEAIVIQYSLIRSVAA